MGRKPKVDSMTKLILVQKYLNGELTSKECIDISKAGNRTFTRWVQKYKNQGSYAFEYSSKNKYYDEKLKLSAINDYINKSATSSEICFKYNISSISVLLNWVNNYNGHKCINSNLRSKTNMAKSRKTTFEERVKLVSECVKNNYNYGYIIDKYNVSYNQIYTWVRKYNKDGEMGLVDNRGKAKAVLSKEDELNAKIKLLEAENRRLQMENDFIKKLEELERKEMLKLK